MSGTFPKRAVRRLLVPALAGLGVLAAAQAAAQEGAADERLREAVDGLTLAVQNLSETVASQRRRIVGFEDGVRSLTGLVEESARSLDRIRDRLDALEAAPAPAPATAAAAPAASPAAAPAAAGTVIPDPSVAGNPTAGVLGVAPSGDDAVEPDAGAPPPFDDPADQYKRAYAFLSRADYAAAQTAFEAFIRDHPDNPLTDNAYYWLGETYYVRDQYEAAAQSFARGYQAAPDEPKAPDMLLKLGLSLVALGRNDDACQAFQRLERSHESLAPRTASRLRAGKDQASCG